MLEVKQNLVVQKSESNMVSNKKSNTNYDISWITINVSFLNNIGYKGCQAAAAKV